MIKNNFQYIEKGKGEVILLLHGLFGELSNWNTVINYFSFNYRVIVPIIPIYNLSIKKTNLLNLVKFLEEFIIFKNIKFINLIGNSLGGHLALMYALRNPNDIKSLTLTGSSGLFEKSMNISFPRRNNYFYIKNKIKDTFFSPDALEKININKIFSIINDINKAMRIILIAKSAKRNNMAKDIVNINTKTLLIWGLNDIITPPIVAHEFNRLILFSKLKLINKCCHAPMMEHPKIFNLILEDFLKKI